MKKLKKLFAVMLSLIMVLAMGITSFADTNTATIKLTNFNDADSLKYMQIIEPDQAQPTGWKFSNDVAENAFKAATGLTDAQTILWKMIIKQNPDATKNTELNIPANTTAITNSEIDKALSTIKNNPSAKWTGATDKTSLTVTSAGVYAFDAEKTGYTYKVATAYVGFENYETAPTLRNTEVAAKKSQLIVTKSVGDDDKAVEIGQKVEYTITTYVPYIDANNASTRTFKITDKISGAAYLLNKAGNVDGEVMMGNAPVAGATIVPAADGKSFEINLDSLVTDTDNPNAGNLITVTYKAKITEVTATNEAKGHKSGAEYAGDNVDLYTGSITLTKVDANNTNTKLANAEFTVQKYNADNTTLGEALKFDYANGVYTYNPESTRQNATTVVTDTNGEVKVEGLDVGKYHFTETKAPNGYSINEAGKDIVLGLGDGVTEATANFAATGDLTLKDSQLSALPATGGIGTTIFTIVGCGIMIAAAGLFFTSRRKENR